MYIYNKYIARYHSIEYAITAIYGINTYQAKQLCRNIGISPHIAVHYLRQHHVNNIINYINKNLVVEVLLHKKRREKFKELLSIKNTRGIRRSQGLPVRGQRTHTNAQTCKHLKQKILSQNKPNQMSTKKPFQKKKNNSSKKKKK